MLLLGIGSIPLLGQTAPPPLAESSCAGDQNIDIDIINRPTLYVNSTCANSASDRFHFRIVKIRTGGTFTFEISPTNTDVDYDYLSWRIPVGSTHYQKFATTHPHDLVIADFNALPLADRGNRNLGSRVPVGLSLTSNVLCRNVEDGKEKWYDVNAGDIIIIGINKYGTPPDLAILDFGGTATMGCEEEKFECVDEDTGLARFDLDQYAEEFRELMVYPPGVPYYYYNTYEQAEQNRPEDRLPSHILELSPAEDGRKVFLTFLMPNGTIEILEIKLRVLKQIELTDDILYGCFVASHPVTGEHFGNFNLNELIPTNVENRELISYKFYRTQAQAEANGTTGLIAQSSWSALYSNSTIIWARLEYVVDQNTRKCVRIVPIELKVVKAELVETRKNLDVCYEDVVNLTQYETYFAAAGTEYTFKYFSANGSQIRNPESYEVTASEIITVKIGQGSCVEEAKIHLNMLETPIVEFYDTFNICDNDYDGLYDVDLAQVTAYLIDNAGNFNYSYYLSHADALEQINPISGTTLGISLTQKIYVRANNDGSCFSIAEVPFILGETVEYTAPSTLRECVGDDNTTIFNIQSVIGGLNLPAGTTYKFYTSIEDAKAEVNEITNTSAWSTTLSSGSVYIVLVKEGYCNTIVEVPFIVEELPTIAISSSVNICEGDVYRLDLSSYEDYTFVVSGVTTISGEKIYDFSAAGTYTITVISAIGCRSTYELTVNVNPVPVFTAVTPFQVCDDNFDGQYEVNLAQVKAIGLANVNATGGTYSVKVYATQEDATAGTNELTGATYTISTALPAKLWFRAIASEEATCFAVTSIDIVNGTSVSFTPVTQVIETCEVANGPAVFNLTSMASLFNLSSDATIKYFTSLADAQNNVNAIANPTAWSTTEMSGTVFVRLDQEGLCSVVSSFNFVVNPLPVITVNDTEICVGETYLLDLSSYTDYTFDVTGGTVVLVRPKVYELSSNATYAITVTSTKGCSATYTMALTVNPLPEFSTVSSFDVCDSNVDGNYELDLDALSGVVLTNNTGITLSYFATEADLLANRNAITGSEYLTRLPARIWVKATTAAGCSVYKSIELVAGSSITVTPPSRPIEVCQGPNGVTEIDLTTIRTQLTVPAGYILSYYPTLTDLQNGTNEILNPTTWTTTTISGTLFIKFETAGLCPGYTSFQYVVNPNPTIDIEDRYYICDGEEFILDLSSYTTLTIDVPGAVRIGNNKFRIDTVGTYNVLVTNAFNCTTEYTFELVNFAPPVVSGIIVGSNTITVNLVMLPTYTAGLLQFSLDGVNFQTSNVLDIPVKGVVYPIYVKVGNCIYLVYDVETIIFPTFFSPNNDGVNDVWRVKPISLTQEVSVKIFDRFGKIVHEQSGNEDIIWNGKVNGKVLPTTDYWYTIDVKGDGVIKAMKYTGSITLKNKD